MSVEDHAMTITRKQKLTAAIVVGVAALAGGGAVAATKLITPSERSQAIINDAAKQLGVQPSALSDALKKALEDQIDADVAAGRLTKEQGDAIKQRIESGDYPVFGFGPGHGFGQGHRDFGFFGTLDAAASYLGITAAQLRDDLASGKTLAAEAKAKGNSVDGLIAALVDEKKKQLDAAVAAGRIT